MSAEYLVFEERETPPGRRTRIRDVCSARSGEKLGHIAWYAPWRQYVFVPAESTLFNPDCLDQISGQVRKMTADHRALLRERKP